MWLCMHVQCCINHGFLGERKRGGRGKGDIPLTRPWCQDLNVDRVLRMHNHSAKGIWWAYFQLLLLYRASFPPPVRRQSSWLGLECSNLEPTSTGHRCIDGNNSPVFVPACVCMCVHVYLVYKSILIPLGPRPTVLPLSPSLCRKREKLVSGYTSFQPQGGKRTFHLFIPAITSWLSFFSIYTKYRLEQFYRTDIL